MFVLNSINVLINISLSHQIYMHDDPLEYRIECLFPESYPGDTSNRIILETFDKDERYIVKDVYEELINRIDESESDNCVIDIGAYTKKVKYENSTGKVYKGERR